MQFWVLFGAIVPVFGFIVSSGGLYIMKFITCDEVLVIIIVSITYGDPYLQLTRLILYGLIEQFF